MSWYFKVLKNWSFEGRAKRKEFWMFFLFDLIVVIVLWILDYCIGSYPIISIIYGTVSFFPRLALMVRRLHDIGKSGRILLLYFVPFIGWIIINRVATDQMIGVVLIFWVVLVSIEVYLVILFLKASRNFHKKYSLTEKTFPSRSTPLINFGENDDPKKNNHKTEKTFSSEKISKFRQEKQLNINPQKEKGMNNSLDEPIAEAVSEDFLYEQALEELDSDNINKATWAKAFAEAEGEDSKSRAFYIKFRVENLKKECQKNKK